MCLMIYQLRRSSYGIIIQFKINYLFFLKLQLNLLLKMTLLIHNFNLDEFEYIYIIYFNINSGNLLEISVVNKFFL